MSENVKIDLLSPEALANPHPLLAELRAHAPITRAYDPHMHEEVWLLTRYDDSIALHKDMRFTKSFERKAEIRGEPQDMASSAAAAINKHMLMSDPPDHTRLRALVHKAFTPRIIENLHPRIQQIADDLLDNVEKQGGMDLKEDFALPLPIIVIAELLGIPLEDRAKFREWSHVILFGATEGDPERMSAAALEFIMYFHNMFDQRRAAPQDDLISGLVQVEEDGDKLDAQELISMVFLLLLAGHETTFNLITNGTLTLLKHPDSLRQLRENSSLMRTAIEEMLRYEGPLGTSTMRWAMEDLEIRGQKIARGELVLSSLLAANRDPQVFANPDIFDITRDPNRHIAFGHGIHYCLGAPLARLEGTVAFSTLLHRLPNLRLAVPLDDLRWSPYLLVHTLESLPVAF